MQHAYQVLFPARGRASCAPLLVWLNLGLLLARYDSSPATSSGNWYKCDDPYGCYLKVFVKPVKHTHARDRIEDLATNWHTVKCKALHGCFVNP